MKTICQVQSIQVSKDASNPISILFAPFHRIKSSLFAMWHGEEAIATPEPTNITENNGETKVNKYTKISKDSETSDFPEHSEKPVRLEIVENSKNKTEDKDSLKNNSIFKNNSNDEDEDEEIEIYYDYYGEDTDEEDIDEEDTDEEYAYKEEIINEKDVNENDKEYILLKNFVYNNILDKNKGPWDGPCDHMDLAVRLVKSVEQQNMFFPVPIDVLCLASYIFSKRQELRVDKNDTMRNYRRRLRQAMRFRHAQDKNKYFSATCAAMELADFIDRLRDCSLNYATSAKPASKETAR